MGSVHHEDRRPKTRSRLRGKGNPVRENSAANRMASDQRSPRILTHDPSPHRNCKTNHPHWIRLVVRWRLTSSAMLQIKYHPWEIVRQISMIESVFLLDRTWPSSSEFQSNCPKRQNSFHNIENRIHCIQNCIEQSNHPNSLAVHGPNLRKNISPRIYSKWSDTQIRWLIGKLFASSIHH